MKIREIVRETASTDSKPNLSKAPADHAAAIKGAVSIPSLSMNKSNGSSYLQYRFGIAMAGAPEYPTQAAGAFAGDPLLSSYTDEELEIMNYAAKQVGAGAVKRLSSNRSEELSNTHKVSPVAKPKRNRYGV
jgi:hypothetical protein